MCLRVCVRVKILHCICESTWALDTLLYVLYKEKLSHMGLQNCVCVFFVRVYLGVYQLVCVCVFTQTLRLLINNCD